MTRRLKPASRAGLAEVTAATRLPAAVAKLLGEVPDPEIAERFGLSLYRVKAERAARSIRPFDGGGRKPGPDGRRSVPRTIWLTSDQEAAIDAARGEQSFSEYVAEAALERARRR